MISFKPTTPVERHGGVFVKRDDKFEVAGVNGGKVRTCDYLIKLAKEAGYGGVVTAGARSSPQANIVATLAQHYGLPCRVHMPSGELLEQGLLAQAHGAEIIQHRPGYNSVIVKRAADDAKQREWFEVPFGMNCQAAVDENYNEALATIMSASSVHPISRIVVPVGSGMTLAGILMATTQLFHTRYMNIPVLGVVVGADPTKRLNKWAPFGWAFRVTLVKSKLAYHEEAKIIRLGGLELDPIYEAKCLPFLEEGDLFWVVGIRNKYETVT